MNKVILMGRLTRDPDVRYAQGGDPSNAYARFSLAVDRRFKRDGQPEADFFNCVAFGKQAEFAEKYLHKGIKMVVEGRIENDNYTRNDGTVVYSVRVIVEGLEFAESRAISNQTSQNYSAPTRDNRQAPPRESAHEQSYSAPARGAAPAPAQAHAPAQAPAPAKETAPAPDGGSDTSADGFMNIPEGIDEELPFA